MASNVPVSTPSPPVSAPAKAAAPGASASRLPVERARPAYDAARQAHRARRLRLQVACERRCRRRRTRPARLDQRRRSALGLQVAREYAGAANHAARERHGARRLELRGCPSSTPRPPTTPPANSTLGGAAVRQSAKMNRSPVPISSMRAAMRGVHAQPDNRRRPIREGAGDGFAVHAAKRLNREG